MPALGVALLVAACDTGSPESQPLDSPFVQVVEVRATQSLAADGTPVRAPIIANSLVLTGSAFEVQLDRFVLPSTATRQSICLASATTPVTSLQECEGGISLKAAYDPTRLTITYYQAEGARLAPDTEYLLTMVPASEDGLFGLRAFDGAPLLTPIAYAFRTSPAAEPQEPNDEGPLGGDLFCCGVSTSLPPCPIEGFGAAASFGSCAYGTCHAVDANTGLGPAMGLNLSPPPATGQIFADPIFSTAIDHVAHETQTGQRASQGSLSSVDSRFGRAMPIIRPGEPGNSYLLYKLAADPRNYPLGGGPSAEEVARLRASLVVGMPMPPTQGSALDGRSLEILSAWIASGAPTHACPP